MPKITSDLRVHLSVEDLIFPKERASVQKDRCHSVFLVLDFNNQLNLTKSQSFVKHEIIKELTFCYILGVEVTLISDISLLFQNSNIKSIETFSCQFLTLPKYKISK